MRQTFPAREPSPAPISRLKSSSNALRTATCPTYQLLGDELDGPRECICLIKQMLESGDTTDETRLHLDRWLELLNNGAEALIVTTSAPHATAWLARTKPDRSITEKNWIQNSGT